MSTSEGYDAPLLLYLSFSEILSLKITCKYFFLTKELYLYHS